MARLICSMPVEDRYVELTAQVREHHGQVVDVTYRAWSGRDGIRLARCRMIAAARPLFGNGADLLIIETVSNGSVWALSAATVRHIEPV